MHATFNHVNLLANSPGLLRAFYTEVFGFTDIPQMSNPPSFYMLYGNGCRLSLQDAALTGQETGTKGIELGIEVNDLPAVIEKVARFPTVRHGEEQRMEWGQAYSVTDPEGHLLNIYSFHRQ